MSEDQLRDVGRAVLWLHKARESEPDHPIWNYVDGIVEQWLEDESRVSGVTINPGDPLL